jgi:hypothetical protein
VTTDFGGFADAFAFTNQHIGTVSSVTIYVNARSRAKRVIVGVYTDIGGHPGARLTSGLTAPCRSAHVAPDG